jgi:hypothetical protein
MINKLKQQPLPALALAIAAGYVLGHIINRALDITYKDALDSNPASGAAWLLAISVLACSPWMLPRLYRSYRRKFPVEQRTTKPHRRRFSATVYAVAVIALMIAGGAWLTGLDQWPFAAIAITVGAFALTCRLVTKVYRWRKNEKWRTNANPVTKLRRDLANADKQATQEKSAHSQAEAGTEARYFEDVDDAFHTMGDRGSIALYAQINPAFLKASMEVYAVGFECFVPEKQVAGFIADAAIRYTADPRVGLLYLEQYKNYIPRLWPTVTEPELQNLVTQTADNHTTS